MAKALGWFALANGILTLASPLVFAAMGAPPLPPFAIACLLVLGAASTVAGVAALKGRSWSWWLLFATFLVQTIEHHSQAFFFSFIGPLSMKVGWGNYSPPSQTSLNLLAILVCVLSLRAARRPRGLPQATSAAAAPEAKRSE